MRCAASTACPRPFCLPALAAVSPALTAPGRLVFAAIPTTTTSTVDDHTLGSIEYSRLDRGCLRVPRLASPHHGTVGLAAPLGRHRRRWRGDDRSRAAPGRQSVARPGRRGFPLR